MSRSFTPDQIRDWLVKQTDRKATAVAVPDWPFDVFVRPLSYGQLKALLEINDPVDQAVETVITAVCDSGGNPILTGDTDWRTILRDKLPAPLQSIAEAALRTNKATAVDVKELEKN